MLYLTDAALPMLAECTCPSELSLRLNETTCLPVLSSWSALRVLDVAHNRVTSLSALSLSALPSLRVLDVSGNRLSGALEVAALTALTALTTLNVSHNALTTLTDELGAALGGLQHLNAANNRLTAVTLNLPALTTLNANANAIASLTLTHVHNLQRLELSHNALERLPSLSACTALEVLTCAANALTALPDMPAHAPLLELRLADNRLGHAPPLELAQALSTQTRLTSLDLAHNGLASVHVGALRALSVLELSRNALTALPSGVSALSRLSTLSLLGNPIVALPEADCAALAAGPLLLLDLRSNAALLTIPTCIASHAGLRSELAQFISPRVLLGPRAFAEHRARLAAHGVTHVLQLTAPQSPLASDPSLTLRVAPMEDADAQQLSPLVHDLSAWISAALSASSSHVVLVHCEFGRSRSAAVVIAHLMRTRGLSYAEALAHVVKCRPIVNPNASFRRQLQALEEELLRAHRAERPRIKE